MKKKIILEFLKKYKKQKHENANVKKKTWKFIEFRWHKRNENRDRNEKKNGYLSCNFGWKKKMKRKPRIWKFFIY